TFPRLRIGGPQLPRPAPAFPRADAAAPQRSVRGAVRTDAGAATESGRCALLRHGIADRRRSLTAAGADEAGGSGLRPAVFGAVVDSAGRVPWQHRDVGSRRSVAEAGARTDRA